MRFPNQNEIKTHLERALKNLRGAIEKILYRLNLSL